MSDACGSTGCTIVCQGSPAITTFAQVTQNSMVFAPVITFNSCSGVTGTRYSAMLNSTIDTNGGGASYFPGNAAGTTATNGVYN
jgi:hypothetical protein